MPPRHLSNIVLEDNEMTKSNSTLTAERLRELLYYDPETGVFTRLISISNSPVGRVAGTQTHSGAKLRTETRRHFELSQDELTGCLSEYEIDAAKRRGWM